MVIRICHIGIKMKELSLTWYSCRVLDSLVDLPVNCHHEITFVGDLQVSHFDSLLHPAHERLSDDRGSNIDDYLLLQSVCLLRDRQVVLKIDVTSPSCKDVLDRKSFIKWDVEMNHLIWPQTKREWENNIDTYNFFTPDRQSFIKYMV